MDDAERLEAGQSGTSTTSDPGSMESTEHKHATTVVLFGVLTLLSIVIPFCGSIVGISAAFITVFLSIKVQSDIKGSQGKLSGLSKAKSGIYMVLIYVLLLLVFNIAKFSSRAQLY